MTPASRLLSRLQAVRQTSGESWMARCPAHEDRSPSLSIREASDGRVLIHCFAGCGGAEVVAAVGLDLRDLFPERRGPERYSPSERAREDKTLPRIPASDALALLDREALTVELCAHRIAEGEEPALLLDTLGSAAGRIAAIRESWIRAHPWLPRYKLEGTA